MPIQWKAVTTPTTKAKEATKIADLVKEQGTLIAAFTSNQYESAVGIDMERGRVILGGTREIHEPFTMKISFGLFSACASVLGRAVEAGRLKGIPLPTVSEPRWGADASK